MITNCGLVYVSDVTSILFTGVACRGSHSLALVGAWLGYCSRRPVCESVLLYTHKLSEAAINGGFCKLLQSNANIRELTFLDSNRESRAARASEALQSIFQSPCKNHPRCSSSDVSPEMLRDDLRCPQMVPYDPRWSQRIPDDPK